MCFIRNIFLKTPVACCTIAASPHESRQVVCVLQSGFHKHWFLCIYCNNHCQWHQLHVNTRCHNGWHARWESDTAQFAAASQLVLWGLQSEEKAPNLLHGVGLVLCSSSCEENLEKSTQIKSLPMFIMSCATEQTAPAPPVALNISFFF